ncbi:hypothetical protein QYF36_025877 [Acer negundo]|nr:hypothetical protein QYF36_025877 [Acer negundo]
MTISILSGRNWSSTIQIQYVMKNGNWGQYEGGYSDDDDEVKVEEDDDYEEKEEEDKKDEDYRKMRTKNSICFYSSILVVEKDITSFVSSFLSLDYYDEDLEEEWDPDDEENRNWGDGDSDDGEVEEEDDYE